MTVQFGLLTPIISKARQPWEQAARGGDLQRIAIHAEQLGFDFLTCGDHAAVTPAWARRYASARFLDPFAVFGYLAAVTDRIRLFVHVMLVPLRHPIAAAKAVASLDLLSNGRLMLGVGTGLLERELGSLNLGTRRLQALTDEYLGAMFALWDQPVAS